ncbi:ATP-binding protein [Sphaerisporangium aureirubrum]|uniref:ATP-binding protein n=1 Tax=Sphaerisporangium aureirubrum TaxID=1544736 RepID=A0ABW1N8U8_9ACTN
MDTPTAAKLGFYPATHDRGLIVHMNVWSESLQAVRGLIKQVLGEKGVDSENVESVRLVASELIANAVKACGHWVPVVVEVEMTSTGIWIKVHDPNPHRLPVRSRIPPNDPEAESGRGLWLLDALAPGWDVALTPVGKQVRCLIPRQVTIPQQRAVSGSDFPDV